ncbi:MAG: putative undecaprenyl-phosphate N-acetylglucosaminyl 1-phosphate transferase [Firmicutes bacterium ADurb.Bin182]|nr:MAG: putative undecaprenyl-phosphate N-acetylglucosaminyl 1-phosphate transferase [Firmicutes bacterium ADurb.Bin182]
MWMIICFFAAGILSLIITPRARRLRIMDRPDYRKIHKEPIPKGGGIGIFIPVILLELAAFLIFKVYSAPESFRFLTVIFVTAALSATGLLDDKYDFNWKIKLGVQITLTIFTLAAGLKFHFFDFEALDIPLTALWILGITNAVNLLDGLDGLAAGVAVLSSAGFAFIGAVFQAHYLMLLSLTVAGACLGFLKYNFRPAQVFMGDAGSVPLGYNLAVLGILSGNAIGGSSAVIIPVLMLGIPIFDTLLTIVRRMVRHRPLFQPDRSHFYNLMIDISGIGHRNTVLVIYAVQAGLIVLSCGLVYSGSIWRVASIFIVAFIACFISKVSGFLKSDGDYKTEDGSINEPAQKSHSGRTDGVRWKLYNGALVPDAPPHTRILMSATAAKKLLKEYKALLMEWPSDFDCGFETDWWYIIRDKIIELAEFNSKRRQHIKNGLKKCVVKKVDAAFIAKHGYEVYKSAFDSYDTYQKPSGPEEFYLSMMSRQDIPVFDFWAAFDKTDNNIIAYFMNRVGHGSCVYSTGKFKPEFLKLGAHPALVYTMTNYYLGDLGFKYVCAGARSISHKTDVQKFLMDKMNFRKAFCRLNVVYAPALRFLIALLYPFRALISKLKTKAAGKITALLALESIRRSFQTKNGGRR